MDKILVVRTDRIGDVLLTTPVSSALRQAFPKAKISWLVSRYTAPLLEHNPDVDEILTNQAQIKTGNFDAAVVAYPRWGVVWALWRAGVPIRIGPASKPYSLLFTHRVWQHRSEGKKHEADYNLELLAPLGVPSTVPGLSPGTPKRYPTRLILTEEEKAKARKTLESHRISFSKPIVFLHPGSGGSSARWPLTHFMELGDRLQASGADVIVTGGPGEDYQSIMIDQMHRIPVFIAAGSVSIRELAALYSCADLVVSNSTGPLHIAVALGVPTVSVYSPIATCHPRRWGPYPSFPEGTTDHRVIVAPFAAELGETEADMAAVTVDDVWRLCQEKLSLKAVGARSAGV